MAARYVSINYDQLEEEYRIINELLLSGQQAKADSILFKKGNFEKRLVQLQKESNSIGEKRSLLSKPCKDMKKPKLFIRRKQKFLGHDCFAKFELCKMSYKEDSAAFFIEVRAISDQHHYIAKTIEVALLSRMATTDNVSLNPFLGRNVWGCVQTVYRKYEVHMRA